ncbi:hypothetical protein E4U42_006197 [Claviceps africana]|uniref:DUF7907 domain-containing protein n=1 Tax=Claviceps africana TaxID=83212 RepID=A0A8K0J3M5_9HYPO|nr:hypothetical protein E4U42_006197 [Claviceps africana]
MHFLTSLLGVSGLALASPLIAPSGTPNGPPPTLKSKGFHLIVNVTDLSRDFSPSIQGHYIDSIHVGAGESLLGVGIDEKVARVFYVNGSALDNQLGHTSVISDTGMPPAPFGISLTQDEGSDIAHTAHLNGGPGDNGIGLTHFPVPYTYLFPETYAICNESIPYYHDRNFYIVKQFQLGLDTFKDIPSNCVPVRLLPQCTKLNDLPKESYSSHEWAYESSCYANVSSIDWTKYQPW